MKKLFVAMSVVAALALAGCGADCESMCEDTKSCSWATDDVKNQDCAKICADAEADAEKFSCTDDYNKYVDCAAGVDDVCDQEAAATSCTTEATAYAACVISFCTSNPDKCAE